MSNDEEPERKVSFREYLEASRISIEYIISAIAGVALIVILLFAGR